MLRTLGTVIAAASLLGCAQARYARTNLEQAVDNPVTQTFEWGEVHCPRGTVCAEVEVLRVDIEQREGGRVEVTLHNRTADAVAVQIAVEILDSSGARLDMTNYQDVPLEPRQETVWDMPGVYQPGARVRLLLRQR